ncbi:MAG: cupin domain-containing protein [Kofleriaceae bacterium]
MGGRWLGVFVFAACGSPTPDAPHPSNGSAFVVAAEGGDVIHRKGNTVVVKVDPRTGSQNLAMGTQHLDPGSGIPMHRHEHEDEVLFVHEGEGVAVLEGTKTVVHTGGTIFIPHGTWHGVESTGGAAELVWVVTPPGLEDYFRDTGVRAGDPPTLTPAELDDIGRKHGTTFKH